MTSATRTRRATHHERNRREEPMAESARIKTAVERSRKAVTLRPSVGQGTAVTTVRLQDGSGGACEISDGPWTLIAGLGATSGGDEVGPDPGVLARAALGSCLAMGYRVWAAMLDIPLDAVTVEVHADYDARGMFGVDGIAPGWQRVRYAVAIESSAPEEDVLRLIEHADARSPLLDDFRRPLEVTREVRLIRAT